MATDDDSGDQGETAEPDDGARGELRGAKERLEEGAEDVAESFDKRAVDLLSWLLDTETRARIYVFLRQNPNATSEEVADGTGLYPSTVREALAELHEDGTVTRRKREASGAGNNPYEYEAIAPSTLVEGVVEQVQSELNTVFNLDRRLGTDASDETEPVTVSVESSAGSDPVDSAGGAVDGDGSETVDVDGSETVDGDEGLEGDEADEDDETPDGA